MAKKQHAAKRAHTSRKSSLGPVEIFAVLFPGNQFKGEIGPALRQMVENRTIRIIDILFIHKDMQGDVRIKEIQDLDEEEYAIFNPVIEDVTGLISESDVEEISKLLDNNSSAALMLFEDTWAIRFRDAVANAKGEVILSERIPREVVDQALAAAEA